MVDLPRLVVSDPVEMLPELASLAAGRPQPDADGKAPTDAHLEAMFHVAATVPDHGALRPWRFVVIQGAGRLRWASALESGLRASDPNEVDGTAVAKMGKKALAAPCAVVIVASPSTKSRIPEWEQVASAACTGYALVLAATALGYGAVWKSASVLDSEPVRSLFGLEEHERSLGWVLMGTVSAEDVPSGRRNKTSVHDPLEGKVFVLDQ